MNDDQREEVNIDSLRLVLGGCSGTGRKERGR